MKYFTELGSSTHEEYYTIHHFHLVSHSSNLRILFRRRAAHVTGIYFFFSFYQRTTRTTISSARSFFIVKVNGNVKAFVTTGRESSFENLRTRVASHSV